VRILLFGAGGQVGSELVPLLAPFARVTALARADVDLGDAAAVRAAVARVAPQVIVNAAAYNDVDGAESDEAGAQRVNGAAVRLLGEEALRLGAVLVHYSTDFVFDGSASRPYREDDATRPLSAYGRSKLAGETALEELGAPALVFRTAWVYSLRRKSFVRSILRAARERDELRVVEDQVGCPTAARDLALATALLLYGARSDPQALLGPLSGIYHLASRDHTSRVELARTVLELDPRRAEQRVLAVVAISSEELKLPAKRPAFAPLDSSRAEQRLGLALPPWRESLSRVLAELTDPLA
jgi:dTDP-4-dehydrorhamnose reductase